MYLVLYFSLGLSSVLAANVGVPELSWSMINNIMGRYLNTPKLVFHPRINPPSTLIRFNKARPSTYQPYIDKLDTILQAYSLDQGAGTLLDDCEAVERYRPADRWNMPCLFRLAELGPDCVKQQNYGYEDGQPCVLFNLERVFRWLPIPYDNTSVPEDIRSIWSEYSVTLKCEGADAPSIDNMGDVTYFPPHGFHFKYFPNTGNPDWKAPLVFVRFENPNPAILIRIVCKVYAQNIIQSTSLDTGVINFELIVD